MISQTAEYALRAVACLARRPDEPQTTRAIAASTRVPIDYLAKVMQTLVRAGLVSSRRGIHGGFLLERPANRITILDVVDAVDPLQRIRKCPLGLEEHGANLCPLHRRLDEAMADIEKTLDGTHISEILESPDGRAPLGSAGAGCPGEATSAPAR